ncbi:MAG: amidohydrolase [Acidobacteria bacterium]|nr:MAG: amidohydrolase [Acidobacteriota bacterium]
MTEDFLRVLISLGVLFFGSGMMLTDVPARPASQNVDLLIRHGKLIDGSGGPPRVGDLGIRGDRIVFIGDAAKDGITAARFIDASGLDVAPGFIHPHTHTLDDLTSAQRHVNIAYLMQGVTTVITGNDGSSPLPIGSALQRWDQQGIGTNAALLVGMCSVRRQVMGMADAVPTAAQLEEMKQRVAQGMNGGGFGMSAGLFYAPCSFAATEEVIELAKVAAEKHGYYDTHMRDESSYSIGLLGSIRETIRIGREAKLPVHISHIKALGTDVWGQSAEAIRIIRAAKAEGIDVTADQYPYSASGTSLVPALVPRWAEAGGREQMLRRFDDPGTRPRLLTEMEQNLKRRGGAQSLLITASADSRATGKNLQQIADERHEAPLSAAIELIEAGSNDVASFNMSEADIENFMKQEFVTTGSDGSPGHPRKFGTFPRKIREYVLKRKVVSLPFAIRSSSTLTAESLGIEERGALRVGYFADVIVFDERTIADQATYDKPELLATGMRYVLVNGKLAVEDGKYNGSLAGKALRKANLSSETQEGLASKPRSRAA